MPTKFDLGDESLKVTARSTKERRIRTGPAPGDVARLKATLPTTLGSMVFTIWFYSNFYGWAIAIGLVLSIFIHECGHALAARHYGLPYMGMRFVPLVGGVVFHAPGNTTVTENAVIGILGPVFGTLVAVTSSVVFFFTKDPFWLSLAVINYGMNAANLLIPAPPLDGHWIAAVFAKRSRATKKEKLLWALLWAALGLFLLFGVFYLPKLLVGAVLFR